MRKRFLMDKFNNIEELNSLHPVSRETFARFQAIERILLQWQKKTNLIAPSTIDEFWRRHLADSLQVFSLYPDTKRWTDIGSGGGFPALIIAAMIKQQFNGGASQNVHMVESIQKKCSFLRRVIIENELPAQVTCKRIESATEQLDDCQIITARALASLPVLFELTNGHVCGKRRALFHKGRDYLREIEECRGQWDFDLIIHPSKIDADSVVLDCMNVRRKRG